MKILAIETSCDETAASVVELEGDGVTVHSNVVATSMQLHATTGGIIPEIAARNQIQYIVPVIAEALEKAGLSFDKNQTPDIDAIAVTYGPGLIGSLLVGVETVKTLAYLWNKPLIPVNHLFGHIYANWIKTDTQSYQSPEFPLIALIVSGGHTDLLLMKNHSDITWLGGTRDDAAGECFDKCARLLGYDYPGGPKISQLAEKGDASVFSFPRPMIGSHDYEFSFSGLKTAFLNKTKEHFAVLRKDMTEKKGGWQQVALETKLSDKEKHILYDLCASLQEAIVDVLVKKTRKAAEEFGVKSIIVSGGVAANQTLRDAFLKMCTEKGLQFYVPPRNLCTDNGAMIGAAACFRQEKADWHTVTANPELYFD